MNVLKKNCDFVFANPDTFKLETEIKFVPPECMTADILVKLILDNPESIKLLNDDLISPSIMVALSSQKEEQNIYYLKSVWR